MTPINFNTGQYAGPLHDPGADTSMRGSSTSADARANYRDTSSSNAAFQGMPVAVATDAFSLVENAEEMSVELADEIDVEISEEDPDEDVRFDEPHHAIGDDEIETYFGTSKQADVTLRAEMVAGMMSGRHQQVGERLRQEHGDDPTAQFLTLQQALHEGERRLSAAATGQPAGAPPTAAALTHIRQAMEDIALRHGPQLRADLNIIGIAGAASDTAAGVKQFQSSYRDIVLGTGTLSSTLQHVLDGFEGDDPAVALTRLTQALGRDLASIRPSIDGVRLNALIQDQFMAETAMSVLERCRTLVGPEPFIAPSGASHSNP